MSKADTRRLTGAPTVEPNHYRGRYCHHRERRRRTVSAALSLSSASLSITSLPLVVVGTSYRRSSHREEGRVLSVVRATTSAAHNGASAVKIGTERGEGVSCRRRRKGGMRGCQYTTGKRSDLTPIAGAREGERVECESVCHHFFWCLQVKRSRGRVALKWICVGI
ncbi:hypothetical protein Hanom_Chr13g01208031 [Helianthus anomalus]